MKKITFALLAVALTSAAALAMRWEGFRQSTNVERRDLAPEPETQVKIFLPTWMLPPLTDTENPPWPMADSRRSEKDAAFERLREWDRDVSDTRERMNENIRRQQERTDDVYRRQQDYFDRLDIERERNRLR